MNTLPTGAFSSQQMQEKIPKGFRKFSLNQFTPEQLQQFRELFSLVGPESDLFRLGAGDEGRFSEIEEPALRQFSELQGGLASRFSGMGMGGRRSSGFQNTMNAAAQDFAKQLQANRQELKRQALMDLMGISSTLLGQRPQETGLQEKRKKGGLGEFFSTLAGGGPGALTGDTSGSLRGMQNILSLMGGF